MMRQRTRKLWSASLGALVVGLGPATAPAGLTPAPEPVAAAAGMVPAPESLAAPAGVTSASHPLATPAGQATGSAPLPAPRVATFSIVGYDPETGDLGVAVQSKFFAVGAVVPWARAGVGAIATQSFANTTYGPRGLELLARGLEPGVVLDSLTANDPQRDQRQVGIVDAKGRSAAYTGKGCLQWAGQASGGSFTAQGNILVGQETVDAMAAAFRATPGSLGDKLMRALEEGQKAGGDSRGQQSAAILIVRAGAGYGGYNDRYCDLRVDDHQEPIRELRRVYDLWKGVALVQEGYTQCEAKNWEKAFALGREAIALHPKEGEPYYHLACYHSKAGQREPALQMLKQAVKRDRTLGKRARTDTDFEPLWQDAQFLATTGK